MTNWQDDPERAAVENIVRHLRTPMRLDDSFEVRVMSAVHAEALARVDAAHAVQRVATEQSLKWWRRSYTLHISPVGALAIAASMIVAIFIGSTALGRSGGSGSPSIASAPAPASNVSNVNFILVDGAAQEVWLVGDFNGWTKARTPMVRSANGNAWTVSLPLTRGRHEYAFIVVDGSGERWLADPMTTTVRDEFGTESSVLHVGPTEGASKATSS